MTTNLATVIRGNRTAVVVLVVGGVVVALYIANRAGDVVESTVDVASDVVRKITSTGFLAAAVLIASLLLGAPLWAAWAATGVYLTVSGGGKLAAGLLARSRGTGTGGLSDAELLRELCKAHGGTGAGIAEIGGTKIGSCADSTVIRLRG